LFAIFAAIWGSPAASAENPRLIQITNDAVGQGYADIWGQTIVYTQSDVEELTFTLTLSARVEKKQITNTVSVSHGRIVPGNP